jgi:hypothetical protein
LVKMMKSMLKSVKRSLKNSNSYKEQADPKTQDIISNSQIPSDQSSFLS